MKKEKTLKKLTVANFTFKKTRSPGECCVVGVSTVRSDQLRTASGFVLPVSSVSHCLLHVDVSFSILATCVLQIFQDFRF